MNEMELKQLWQTSGERLEKSIDLINQQQEDIAHLKVQNLVSSMKPIKIFTIVACILWVGIVGKTVLSLMIYAPSEVSVFFIVSAAAQVGLTALALIVYLYQLITIWQVDITESLLRTQERLAGLRASTLWATRIGFLQLPFWTTFYWSESMIKNGNLALWIIQVLLTLLFTYAALWLFVNIRYENKDKKWFQLLFSGHEWDPVIKSMDLLEQIGEYKREKNS
ncbi:hypothetical protein GZH53_12720 [Flavihumibacter sp. R14]|nr:hypothetical protein [Flavihumibacter soli]